MFHNRATLGAALLGQKNYAEAEPLLLEGYLELVKLRDHPSAANIQLYTQWGKPEQGAEWRAKVKSA